MTDGDDGHQVLFSDPAAYLLHLADTLCAALAECSEEERADWLAMFRRFADDDLAIYRRGRPDEGWAGGILATLSPENGDAMVWARQCILSGLARPALPGEPDSVIGRLAWPTPLGGRARDD